LHLVLEEHDLGKLTDLAGIIAEPGKYDVKITKRLEEASDE
jgi:hypothetical protein